MLGPAMRLRSQHLEGSRGRDQQGRGYSKVGLKGERNKDNSSASITHQGEHSTGLHQTVLHRAQPH